MLSLANIFGHSTRYKACKKWTHDRSQILPVWPVRYTGSEASVSIPSGDKAPVTCERAIICC